MSRKWRTSGDIMDNRMLKLYGEGASADFGYEGLGRNYGFQRAAERKGTKYPWLRETDKLGPLVKNYIKREIARAIHPHVPEDTRLKQAVKRMLGAYINSRSKALETDFQAFSPKLAAIDDLRRGATELESMYVVLDPATGIEVPIYMQKVKHSLPTDLDNTLADHIRYIMKERESKYNDQPLSEFFRGGFSEPGGEWVTLENYPDMCIDTDRFKKWWTRDGTNNLAKNGNVLEERTLTVDGSNYTIRKYGDVSEWSKFKHWLVTGLVFRATEPFFVGPKVAAHKLSTEFGQWFFEEQYRFVSGITRSLMGKNKFDYDLTRN
jgi:hypothetical protein